MPRTQSQSQSTTTRAGARIDGGPASIESSIEAGSATETDTEFPTVPLDVNHICNSLSGKPVLVVLEDFHLVTDSLAARLSEDLKHFLDEEIQFLLIGIPSSPGRTLKNNPDLGGRTEKIIFDYLLDEEIVDLIEKGERKLNVSLTSQVRKRVIDSSMHNAYLVQAICQRLLLDAGVQKRANETVRFRDSDRVDAACEALANELESDYDNIVSIITAGQRKQKANKAYNQYEEILRAVRDASVSDLERGISYTYIGQNTWSQFSPEKVAARIDSGNYKDENSFKMALNNQISQALNRLDDSFSKAGARPVLIYNDGKLYLLDLVFKFFLRWKPGVVSDVSVESA